ncbi:hypothetical protein BN439_1840 [Erwinia amylovora Ea644]|nr:hypothetical protein BN439_1840 [Erwinia amylovora Ea644]CCP06931.1 hypothetical protein BN440_1905 [Erwinia amylovora MR1]
MRRVPFLIKGDGHINAWENVGAGCHQSKEDYN